MRFMTLSLISLLLLGSGCGGKKSKAWPDGAGAEAPQAGEAAQKKPAAEPEIAVHLGKDLPGGADRATAIAAIAGLGPTIELADVNHPSNDVEGTLARNIYQRHVVLGAKDVRHAGGVLEGLTGRVIRNDAEIAKVTDLQALTGELIDIVRHTADLLAAFGEKLEAGQILIAGSIVPPLWITPGEELVFRLERIDNISIRFT